MIASLKRAHLLDHLPLLFAIAAWLVVSSVRLLFTSEIVRATLAVACVALMGFQWAIYRRRFFRSTFVLLSLIVAWVVVISLWLGLNVVRYYTYNPENARTWAWHTAVIQVQFPLAWAAMLLLLIIFVWLTFLFARWMGTKIRRVVSQPTP